jgi:hypothetical protein
VDEMHLFSSLHLALGKALDQGNSRSRVEAIRAVDDDVKIASDLL